MHILMPFVREIQSKKLTILRGHKQVLGLVLSSDPLTEASHEYRSLKRIIKPRKGLLQWSSSRWVSFHNKEKSMKRMSLMLLVSIFVLAAWAVQAEVVVSDQPTTQAVSEKEIPDGSVNGSQLCSLCFTCGGNYPVFSGGFRSMGDNPTERGGACEDPLQGRTDSFPFLCCNF